jgi:protocatechuate 3,4-dioxygenase beta subunit
MNAKPFLLFSALLGIAFPMQAAWAAPACKPTATVKVQNYPGASSIVTSNNLVQPAGKSVAAEGQKLIIKGRVLDSRCMPIPEMVVELWQNSPTGRWLLAGDRDLATPDPVFAGVGRTYTDNEGRFTFITAFPAPLGKSAPFVNVKVKGYGMADFSTALFFENDARNDNDTGYKKLESPTRQSVTLSMSQSEEGDIVGAIDLVLPSKAPYRTY